MHLTGGILHLFRAFSLLGIGSISISKIIILNATIRALNGRRGYLQAHIAKEVPKDSAYKKIFALAGAIEGMQGRSIYVRFVWL